MWGECAIYSLPHTDTHRHIERIPIAFITSPPSQNQSKITAEGCCSPLRWKQEGDLKPFEIEKFFSSFSTVSTPPTKTLFFIDPQSDFCACVDLFFSSRVQSSFWLFISRVSGHVLRLEHSDFSDCIFDKSGKSYLTARPSAFSPCIVSLGLSTCFLFGAFIFPYSHWPIVRLFFLFFFSLSMLF